MALLEKVKRKLIVNAGHYVPGDSGFVCEKCGFGNTSLKEAEFVIKIRNELVPMLKRNLIEVTEIPDDRNLSQSIAIANVAALGLNDALAIDIHLNSRGYAQTGEIRGCEVYSGSSLMSSEIARVLSRNIARIAQIPDRGYKVHTLAAVGSLGWIAKTNCWAVVIECLYLDNPADRELLLRPDGPNLIAKGILAGILELYGMKEVEDLKVNPEQAELDRLQKILDSLRALLVALTLKLKGRLGKLSKF